MKKKKPLQPDWSAINRSFNAKQRRAFNAFHGRLSYLIGELHFEAQAGDHHPVIKDYTRRLHADIFSIPWMFK